METLLEEIAFLRQQLSLLFREVELMETMFENVYIEKEYGSHFYLEKWN